jgi:hypothetical protein
MLSPAPVVVDADVLLRNVDYAVHKGYSPALLAQASANYSLFSGVVLFAAPEVGGEVFRHLPDIASRRHVSVMEVQDLWNSLIVPNVRFVPVDLEDDFDPRVAHIRKDPASSSDAPTAALAALLAPVVLLTDNRRHFRPFGLSDVKSDAIALDLFTLGRFGIGARGAVMFPTVAGSATIEGTKRLSVALGRDLSLLIGLVALGALALFLTTDRGRSFRAKMAEVARQVGPPLQALMEEVGSAGERVEAFAVEAVGEPRAISLVARHLAVGQARMATGEIAQFLRESGFRFQGGASHATATRAWLERESCFHEVSWGHWALGYHASPAG